MATLAVRRVLETGFRWGMEQNFSFEWRADVFGRGKGDCDGGAIRIHYIVGRSSLHVSGALMLL